MPADYDEAAGNHDLSLDPVRKDSNVQTESIQICRELFNSIPGLAYLQHSSAVIELPDKGVSLNVFGSPHSAEQQGGRYSAFQYAADDAVATWDAIPADTDVLITHTPPATVCDQSAHYTEGGCRALLEAVARVRPVLHICGHYHEGWGAETVRWAKRSGGKDISRLSWQDPGAGNKKLSLLDLTGKNGRALEKGMETAVVNASMVVRDLKTGKKTFNKPVIVDIFV